MSKVKRLKLPLALSSNATALRIKDYVERLGPSSGYFSSILYQKNKKRYFLKKDENFPLISFDWIMYTLMRSYARTIITSGSTLRKEQHCYTDDLGSFGRDDIKQIYTDNVIDPFNLIVFSKKMKDDEIRRMISNKYFKYVSIPEVCKTKQNTHSHTFRELAQKANQSQMGPVIYENGQKTLSEGLWSVKQNEPNFTELVVLSLYHGPMEEKYIGNEYDLHILNRDFDKAWESESIKSDVIHDSTKNQKHENASLKFVVYTRKESKYPVHNTINHNTHHTNNPQKAHHDNHKKK